MLTYSLLLSFKGLAQAASAWPSHGLVSPEPGQAHYYLQNHKAQVEHLFKRIQSSDEAERTSCELRKSEVRDNPPPPPYRAAHTNVVAIKFDKVTHGISDLRLV